jgi:hypothetical protein
MRADINKIFVYYLGQCQRSKAVEILAKMQVNGHTPDTYTFNNVIQAFSDDIDNAMQIFNNMRMIGVNPDKFTYTILINICIKKCVYEQAEYL